MSKKRVSLVVDHPLRDLPGLSLVAYSLAKLDFDVFLVPMYAQERECLALAPDFVLLNYLRKNNEPFVERLIKSNIQFGVNDTEGGFYGDLNYYGKILSQNTELYSEMNCNLIWGQKMLNYLKNDFGIRQNLVLTGLPRFDFYSPRYRKIDLNLLPENLKGKNISLINTKVALANPLFVSVEREIDLYRNKLGFSEEIINHFLTYGKLSIEDNIALAKALAEYFNDTKIIIRPHPHERAETYSEQIDIQKYSQVHVFREGPVIPWILSSKSIIHRHCTTAIEAALAGIPALAPTWVRTSANAPDAEKVSHQVNNLNELFELVKLSNENRLAPTDSIKNELARIIDDWLYQVDGESHSRVALAIADSLKTGKRASKDIAQKQMYQIFGQHLGAKGAAYHLFNQMGRHFNAPLWAVEKSRLRKWKTTQKYFTPSDIKNWISPVQKFEKSPELNISWAVETSEYLDNYPGFAVKVSKI